MPPIYWVVRKPFSILHNTSSFELEEDTVNRAIISDIGYQLFIKHLRTTPTDHHSTVSFNLLLPLQQHLKTIVIAAAHHHSCKICLQVGACRNYRDTMEDSENQTEHSRHDHSFKAEGRPWPSNQGVTVKISKWKVELIQWRPYPLQTIKPKSPPESTVRALCEVCNFLSIRSFRGPSPGRQQATEHDS